MGERIMMAAISALYGLATLAALIVLGSHTVRVLALCAAALVCIAHFVAQSPKNRISDGLNITAMVLAIVAIILFATGS